MTIALRWSYPPSGGGGAGHYPLRSLIVEYIFRLRHPPRVESCSDKSSNLHGFGKEWVLSNCIGNFKDTQRHNGARGGVGDLRFRYPQKLLAIYSGVAPVPWGQDRGPGAVPWADHGHRQEHPQAAGFLNPHIADVGTFGEIIWGGGFGPLVIRYFFG